MDQKKIGSFIGECRKEKGLTQSQLAEHFGISNRAVSKWETGKSLPDASIMIDLCTLLNITVNELLSGERMSDTKEYQNRANENMVELQGKLQSLKKRILFSNLFLLLIGIICLFADPKIVIFVIFVALFRNYYLFKKADTVKKTIHEKGEVKK